MDAWVLNVRNTDGKFSTHMRALENLFKRAQHALSIGVYGHTHNDLKRSLCM